MGKINKVLQDLLMAFLTGAVFGLMKYLFGEPVDLKDIIIFSVMYFLVDRLISFIASKLRKLIGFKK